MSEEIPLTIFKVSLSLSIRYSWRVGKQQQQFAVKDIQRTFAIHAMDAQEALDEAKAHACSKKYARAMAKFFLDGDLVGPDSSPKPRLLSAATKNVRLMDIQFLYDGPMIKS